MNFKVAISIFLLLCVSRFIPHPPNFTSLIALSIYVPIVLGQRYILILLLSFIFTDILIGFHSTVFFTWSSILIISLSSLIFRKSLIKRIFGALAGASVFYIITNFGVWTTGIYGYTMAGLVSSYILAIPFFGYTLISTLIFSTLIETGIKYYELNYDKKIF